MFSCGCLQQPRERKETIFSRGVIGNSQKKENRVQNIDFTTAERKFPKKGVVNHLKTCFSRPYLNEKTRQKKGPHGSLY